jgi:hypothetical protein
MKQTNELPNPTNEQLEIIKCLENNIIIDSVAGSGKTTTNLYIAQSNINKNILLLTYNSKLKLETKEKIKKYNINNLNVFSYHSFCVKYYDSQNGFTDKLIIDIINNNNKCKLNFNYDLIILDEAQDISPLYYKLIYKIYNDNIIKNINIILLGDVNQSIYDFNQSDERYILYADKLFNYNNNPWKKLNLSTSFRITHEMSLFINNCMLNNNRINSTKITSNKPRYIICNSFNKINSQTLKEVEYYLNLGYKPQDFFILAPSLSVKGDNISPVKILENNIKLKYKNINIYVPTNDNEKLDNTILENKMVFSTFHQSKGLERPVIIIFNFDNSYFKYYKKDNNPYICPNELYVATTRGSERLSLIHHCENDYLPFLNLKKLQNFTIFNKYENINNINKTDKDIKTGVTDLCKHLPLEIILKCLTYLNIIKINNKDSLIDIPIKIEETHGSESISEITGIAIPLYFEYSLKNNSSIYNNLKDILENKTLHNKKLLEDIQKRLNINILKLDKKKDYIKLSNIWNSYKNGYIFKSLQISTYNWISKSNLNESLNRLTKLNITNNAIFEKYIKYKYLGIDINGYIDCIDNNNMYEFKCCQEIKEEHFLQLGIYMFINESVYNSIKQTKYFLFNILNNEQYEITANYNNLNLMLEYLIKYKYKNKNKVNDEDFINNNLNLLNKKLILSNDIITIDFID